MKKVFALLTIIVIMVLSIGVSSVVACADDDLGGGYHLTDYDVKIVYDYFIEYSQGIYFAYDVMFDVGFFDNIEDKEGVLNTIGNTFALNGYTLTYDKTYGRMTASLSFDSINDYYIACGIDGYEQPSGKAKANKGFLYIDSESTSQTVFANLKQEGKFINRIYEACKKLGISDDKILLEYVYGTPYSTKMLTSTADNIAYVASSKLYLHSFDMTVDECEREITLYQHSPNPAGWYTIAICFGVVVLILPLTVYIINRKKEKRTNG